MAEISVFPVPLTVSVLSSPRPRVVPLTVKRLPELFVQVSRSVEPYTGSNRERESAGVIDQNAGTADALECEDLGGAGRDRDVLSDTCRHMEFADNRTYGDIGLIAECAVEAGGLEGVWRASRGPVSGIIPIRVDASTGPGSISIHLLRLKRAGLAARSNI